MGEKWTLDTGVAIIKGKPASVLKKLRGKSVGQVGISAITLGELAFGAAKSGRRDEAHSALAEFLLALEIAGFDAEAAASYGQVRAWPEKRATLAAQNLNANCAISTRGRRGISALMNGAAEMFVGP